MNQNLVQSHPGVILNSSRSWYDRHYQKWNEVQQQGLLRPIATLCLFAEKQLKGKNKVLNLQLCTISFIGQ
jgi:hypothetical protein